MEQMNQELEQYLRFFTEYRQKDWPEWLVIAEFAVNNKVHSAKKVLLFMVNYGRELRIESDIRRKEKVEKITEFAERMRKVQKKAGAALKKAQEKMKQQVGKSRKKVETWKKRDKVMLSTKDLVFRERSMKNLTEKYVRSYVVEEVVSKNVVKLRLLAFMRIYPVISMSKVLRYREPGKRQKAEEPNLVEVDGVEK